jgi:hypothetical protein
MEKTKLIGLQFRSTNCKICNVFSDEILNEITLDLLLQRKSWNEIVKAYNHHLPLGIPKLNHVNLRNHKKHCDPKLIAEEWLRDRGEPVTPAEAVMHVFSNTFLKELDRKRLLTEMYRSRLRNLESLQFILLQKVRQLNTLGDDQEETKQSLVDEICSISKQVDSVMSNMQDIVVKELNSDKGLAQTQQTVNINFINNVQIHIQNFLEEIVPYILVELFKDDPVRGKEFLKYLSTTMDKHLTPALDETKLLQQVTR